AVQVTDHFIALRAFDLAVGISCRTCQRDIRMIVAAEEPYPDLGIEAVRVDQTHLVPLLIYQLHFHVGALPDQQGDVRIPAIRQHGDFQPQAVLRNAQILQVFEYRGGALANTAMRDDVDALLAFAWRDVRIQNPFAVGFRPSGI